MPTRNELINCYRKLSDAELMRLALHEADVLIPEALDVLKEEIKTRRLAGPLEAVIGIQTRFAESGRRTGTGCGFPAPPVSHLRRGSRPAERCCGSNGTQFSNQDGLRQKNSGWVSPVYRRSRP